MWRFCLLLSDRPITKSWCSCQTRISQTCSFLFTHHCYFQKHLSNRSHCLQFFPLLSASYAAARPVFPQPGMPVLLWPLKGAGCYLGIVQVPYQDLRDVKFPDHLSSPFLPSSIFSSPAKLSVVPECSVSSSASGPSTLPGVCTHHCLNFQITLFLLFLPAQSGPCGPTVSSGAPCLYFGICRDGHASRVSPPLCCKCLESREGVVVSLLAPNAWSLKQRQNHYLSYKLTSQVAVFGEIFSMNLMVVLLFYSLPLSFFHLRHGEFCVKKRRF